MTLDTVLIILGILLVVDSLFPLLAPEWSQKTIRKMVKSVKRMRKIGFIELIIGVALFLIAINL